jgi:hypothetical protein
MFFNANVDETGGTPDWEHTLGQGRPLHLLKELGCSEILNGLTYNLKSLENFNYGSGGNNYDVQIVSIFENVKIIIYDSESKTESTYDINKPLIVILVYQNSGFHEGRRLLKMSNGFTYNEIKNSDFYDAINEIVINPWFGYKINYDNLNTGILTLTIIKAPIDYPNPANTEIRYKTKEIRKKIWDDLAEEYANEFEVAQDISAPKSKYSSEKIMQKIIYGAPGTGKSHKVNEILADKENRTERVTFHPEYDYNAFVGGYKPTMNGDNIIYEFVPQTFTKIYCDAWNSLASENEEEFYLVIEEINRGNCAEIFGDIFQLLDRNSDYEISPSKELKEFLLNEEKGLINKDFGLQNGKLKLPPNLNILATMNTSDQSLFPMDSAFKRRWDWEYIPINYEPNYINSKGETKPNESFSFIVKISETESFSWLSFTKAVNTVIKNNNNLGMDKCLGNYFIKPVKEVIDIDTFINKAIFYLWNDIFKDEERIAEKNIFENEMTYEDFFPVNTNGIEKIKRILDNLKVKYKTVD